MSKKLPTDPDYYGEIRAGEGKVVHRVKTIEEKKKVRKMKKFYDPGPMPPKGTK